MSKKHREEETAPELAPLPPETPAPPALDIEVIPPFVPQPKAELVLRFPRLNHHDKFVTDLCAALAQLSVTHAVTRSADDITVVIEGNAL